MQSMSYHSIDGIGNSRHPLMQLRSVLVGGVSQPSHNTNPVLTDGPGAMGEPAKADEHRDSNGENGNGKPAPGQLFPGP
eukprot:scaffold67323_cov18-Tisochrysis_lutea.AAC.1